MDNSTITRTLGLFNYNNKAIPNNNLVTTNEIVIYNLEL